MRLPAALRDGHSCVYEMCVDKHLLRFMWNGLDGGGLSNAWDDGIAFVRGAVDGHSLLKTVPLGFVVEWVKGGVSTFLDCEKDRKLGYLRITGGMDLWTGLIFSHALDGLEGMEALLLDCRSMGGGADKCLWCMAGRLFPGGVDNGSEGRIDATGLWQFDGPIVLLQDENQVSAAESFTIAMNETERAIDEVRKDCAAQEMLLAITDESMEADEASREEFLTRFGSTRTGRYIREHVWKRLPDDQ